MSQSDRELSDLRYGIAGIVKALLLAREMSRPGSIDQKILEVWELHNIKQDRTLSLVAILRPLILKIDKITEDFAPESLSNDYAPPEEVCYLLFQDFVSSNSIKKAVERLEDALNVNWRRIAKWNLLSNLREALDQLPRREESPIHRVLLVDKDTPPVVNGRKKRLLTFGQFRVVKALLESGNEGLTKDVLERVNSDARKILKRLAASDPDWKSVIQFAGSKGRGYRIQ